jgi:hypothetical protein
LQRLILLVQINIHARQDVVRVCMTSSRLHPVRVGDLETGTQDEFASELHLISWRLHWQSKSLHYTTHSHGHHSRGNVIALFGIFASVESPESHAKRCVDVLASVGIDGVRASIAEKLLVALDHLPASIADDD